MYWEEIYPSFCLSGEGAKAFLHGQTSFDFLSSNKGEIIRTCWLSTTGKINALLEVLIGLEDATIIVLAGDIKNVMKNLDRIIFPADKVKIKYQNDIRRIQFLSSEISWKESKVEWISIDSELSMDLKKLDPINKFDLELWKIKQGFPNSDKEINGDTNPFEIGLADLVSLEKGCYLGQEAMARIIRQKSLKTELRNWELHTSENQRDLDKEFLNKLIVNWEGKTVGSISSFVKHDDGKFSGLALIRSKYIYENQITLLNNSDKLRISVPVGFNGLKSLKS